MLLSIHADRQGGDIVYCFCLFVVGLFVCLILCICTVTDFFGEDTASGVKFCTVVHRRPGQEISHFWELCSTETENQTNRSAAGLRRIGMCG